MTVLITLTTYGSDTGPFDIYSNATGSFVIVEQGVSKNDLIVGYELVVPDNTTQIKVESTGVCTNDIVLGVTPLPTTTTTSSSSTTTTSSSSTTTTTTTTEGETTTTTTTIGE
jgi:hypothetical protein